MDCFDKGDGGAEAVCSRVGTLRWGQSMRGGLSMRSELMRRTGDEGGVGFRRDAYAME
jgi:hypothetical protein